MESGGVPFYTPDKTSGVCGQASEICAVAPTTCHCVTSIGGSAYRPCVLPRVMGANDCDPGVCLHAERIGVRS